MRIVDLFLPARPDDRSDVFEPGEREQYLKEYVKTKTGRPWV
jgi:hypothetical protein